MNNWHNQSTLKRVITHRLLQLDSPQLLYVGLTLNVRLYVNNSAATSSDVSWLWSEVLEAEIKTELH